MLQVKVYVLLAVVSAYSEKIILPAVVYKTGGSESCPSSEAQESIRRNVTSATRQALQNIVSCGGLGWTQVINLNMSDPSQQCPSPWRQYTSPARSCSQSSSPGCQGISFPVPVGTYTRVCGRITGYSLHTSDAFLHFDFSQIMDINGVYLDGVSITSGSPRQHIWSFAATGGGFRRCPCLSSDRSQAPLPQPFVGENYFCDVNQNRALWDGKDCTDACCTFNSPPYFTATLPAPTSDDLEVRICTDQEREDEAVHVSLLQLYVL